MLVGAIVAICALRTWLKTLKNERADGCLAAVYEAVGLTQRYVATSLGRNNCCAISSARRRPMTRPWCCALRARVTVGVRVVGRSAVALLALSIKFLGAGAAALFEADQGPAGSVPWVPPSALLTKAGGRNPRHTFRPVAGFSSDTGRRTERRKA